MVSGLSWAKSKAAEPCGRLSVAKCIAGLGWKSRPSIGSGWWAKPNHQRRGWGGLAGGIDGPVLWVGFILVRSTSGFMELGVNYMAVQAIKKIKKINTRKARKPRNAHGHPSYSFVPFQLNKNKEERKNFSINTRKARNTRNATCQPQRWSGVPSFGLSPRDEVRVNPSGINPNPRPFSQSIRTSVLTPYLLRW